MNDASRGHDSSARSWSQRRRRTSTGQESAGSMNGRYADPQTRRRAPAQGSPVAAVIARAYRATCRA
jgi:hypothetical protein